MNQRKQTLTALPLVIVTFLFQLCHSLIWGLDPQKPVEQYLVDQWEMTDGIPSNTVNAMAQTPDGYLWFGTSRDLVRFDGVKFKPFSEKGDLDLKEIRTLRVDAKGTLWIGTAHHLLSYQYRTGTFKTYTPAEGILPEGIRHIKDDSQGNLWISYDSSYVSRLADHTFTTYDSSAGLMGKKINAIIQDNQGNVLFGSRETGVFSYKKDRFTPYPIPGLENIFIITMFEDSEQELWIGSLDSGLFRVTPAGTVKYTTTDGLTGNHITSIIQDIDRNIWVSTTKGLNRLTRSADGTLRIQTLLNAVSIYCLLEDRERSIWVGTEASGLKRIKDSKFTSYEPLDNRPDEIPFALFQDSHGVTWIGTEGGKLFCNHNNTLIASPVSITIGITAIAQDIHGDLCLGTIGKGVFHLNNNRIVPFTTPDPLADNVVTSIYRDSHHNLWFSTFDGVSVFHAPNNTTESLKSTSLLSGQAAHNVYESKAGDIWIATDKGITILPKEYAALQLPDGKKRAPAPPKVLFPGVSVTCIYEDIDSAPDSGSIFWVATQGEGVKRIQVKDSIFAAYTIASYTSAQGLPTNVYYQFLEDLQGHFWFMSDCGILRVSKSELNALASGSLEKPNVTVFGIADGMKSLEFNNKFSTHAALKTRDGEFWFLTKKGIAIVNPATLRFNPIPPPVIIEGISINQQTLHLHPHQGPLVFKGIRDLSIYFTAPTFLSPEKVRFKYQMQGLNPEWMDLAPGSGRVAHYKGLPPGTHTFTVTACNADGVWNPTGDAITFTLKEFFYQTIGFKIATLFLIIALLAIGFNSYRKRRLEKKIKYKDSPLDPHLASQCIKNLNTLMEVEKVYRDADMSLPVLAEKMSLSAHQLSQLLNEKMDRNFFDYLNQYRIEAAIKILQSPRGSQRKVSAIAMDVGFNTMAAFYKAFKKYTGKTPSWYQKQATEKK